MDHLSDRQNPYKRMLFSSQKSRYMIASIRSQADDDRSKNDAFLLSESLRLKYLANTGVNLESLIPRAFALVYESLRRTLQMEAYDVQLVGAIELARCRIVEMKTGEGKTLTGAFATYLHALTTRGSHVATFNDYLAQRDFEMLAPVFQRLGLNVGLISSANPPNRRRQAYAKDITFGTAKEFGFDFLRDRLTRLKSGDRNRSAICQRGLNYVLVDEADSILIDEARTPLIIGLVDEQTKAIQQRCARWCSLHAAEFKEHRDFKCPEHSPSIELLPAGRRKLRELSHACSDDLTRSLSFNRLLDFMQNAIKAERDFKLDQNYLSSDGRISIIDEYTGRVATGRQWQNGLHQAIEAKESLQVTQRSLHGATITLQAFFNLYRTFSGMTGTAWPSRRELNRVYAKKVVRIDTNRPVIRSPMPASVFINEESKWRAVVNEAGQFSRLGRPVLIGTRSIRNSEELSRRLSNEGIQHSLLTAKQVDEEAAVVRFAGEPGRVTVATNMAGRGTDIKLSSSVSELGGLHVVLTELHESSRIDWQLIGRGARQGDPGSYRIFLSLDDEILESGLGEQRLAALQRRFQSWSPEEPLPDSVVSRFYSAQRAVERSQLTDRTLLCRIDKEKRDQHIEMGLDPYCEMVN